MSKCAVLNCPNTQRMVIGNISFHSFPSDPNFKAKWIEATGTKDWCPTKSSRMCSAHFSQDNFTKTGNLRRLAKTAIPTINILKTLSEDKDSRCIKQPASCETMKMKKPRPVSAKGASSLCEEICRVCLGCDRTLYEMQRSGLEESYVQLTGVNPRSSAALPQAVCGYCAHLLRKFHKLQQSALLANDTLHSLLREHGRMSSKLLRNVDIKPSSHYLRHCALSPISFVPIEYVDPLLLVEEPIEAEEHLKEEHSSETDDKIDNADCDDVDSGAQELNELSSDKVKNEEWKGIRKKKRRRPGKGIFDSPDTSESLYDRGHSSKPKERTKVMKKIETARETSAKAAKRTVLLDEELKRHFTIIELSLEEQIAMVEKRKESANYTRSQYKCDDCFRGFNRQETFLEHTRKHTDAAKHGDIVCPVCKLRAKSVRSMQRHSLNHKREYRCNDCSFVTFIKDYAKSHYLSHQGAKIVCPLCNMSFDRGTSYLSHIRLVHPSNFACELCGYSFVSLYGVKSHKNLKHRYDDQQLPPDAPSCALCDIKFISEAALRTHQRVSPKHQAPDEKRHRNCVPKPAKSDGSRAKTKKSMPNTPIPCEQCGVTIATPRAYAAHFRREHPGANRTAYPGRRRRVMCEVCGRIYQTGRSYLAHARSHAASARRQLAARPAACAVCGVSIKHRSNMRRHLMLHKAERAFPCELCGRRFPNKGHRDAHYRHKHLGVPYPGRCRRPLGAALDSPNAALAPELADEERS